ncbi:hypothetical protein CcrC1_gp407 [Caulobacter phage C1]|nr:hypothetical protein CcrC1_gp407 [Caulobacter phage C1]UTU08636.1 hypothetical protein CcrC2_gp408 [Caulobacter phage C2]UXY92608.1 hypothetical protein CcrJ4_gp402 [Caulobacter phage J4]WGN97302.1 hypothetical protein [Bertelyvirus sp.]WGN97821.1 hypothetical protein [Bertelyvirus sp.]
MNEDVAEQRLSEWGAYDARRGRSPSQDHPAYREAYERAAHQAFANLDPCPFCRKPLHIIGTESQDLTVIQCMTKTCPGDVRIALTDPDKHKRWVLLAHGWNNQDTVA